MSAYQYTDYHFDWEGIALLVKWCPSWLGDDAVYQTAHLEIYAAGNAPLPVTETGYRSHFIDRDAVEALGGAVAYVRAWLDEAAASPEWQAKAEADRQPSLF